VSRTVTVVDYGVGNLLSVARAFEQAGARVRLADRASEIAHAEVLVLPGVGAFADGMAELRNRRLDAPVADFAKSGKPLLGICLGMQMLLSASDEFGEHAGLGIIPGRVRAIPPVGTDGQPHKIPHIGWNALRFPRETTNWDETLLHGTEPGTAVYFVHTYTADPDNPAHRLADCHYDGQVISAAIRDGLVFGCQFHPEKSGPAGLRILARFLSLA
jgi:imidazole glycerol-phosphate synthase subunit HisH